MSSVGTEFPKELERARRLLSTYESFGPGGAFGAAVIRAAIGRAEVALASDDVVEVIRSYAELRDLA